MGEKKRRMGDGRESVEYKTNFSIDFVKRCAPKNPNEIFTFLKTRILQKFT